MKAASYFIGVHGVPPKAVRQKNTYKGKRSPSMILMKYYNENYKLQWKRKHLRIFKKKLFSNSGMLILRSNKYYVIHKNLNQKCKCSFKFI